MKRQMHDGKNCYPTWDAAAHAALVASKRRGTALRAYSCDGEHGCGGFHLTKRKTWVERPTSTPSDLARLISKRKDAS